MKKNLFLSGLYAFLLLAGMLFLLCVFNSCAPEDDLPAEGITSETVLPDDHVEWTGGTRYFPLRIVYVNLEAGDYDVEGHLDYLNEVFSAIDAQFYVSRVATLYVYDPVLLENYIMEKIGNLFAGYINLYVVPVEILLTHEEAASGYAGGFFDNPHVVVAIYNRPSMRNIIVHEFGHVFGLGHVYGDPRYPNNFMTNPSGDAVFEQDQLDLMRQRSLKLPIAKGGMP